MIHEFIVLLVLLLLSALFSSAETSLISLSPAKVRALVDRKKPGALLVEKIKSNPHRLLITILIGNNLVNISTSVYATIVFQKLLGNAALGIITGALTLVILVFGEIMPKSLAQAHARPIACFVAPFLYFFTVVFRPMVFFFDLLVKGMLKLTTGDSHEKYMMEEELKAFVSLGAEEGSIERDEQELIENVLEFNDTRVEEIMVARVNMQALSEDATIKEAADFVALHHHSRIPVYRDSVDNIVGVITVKDVLKHMSSDHDAVPLSSLKLHKPLKVPGSKKINRLFNEFQKRRLHLAIVLDEHGGTAGLITLEDILEEIVGDIVDEFDTAEVSDIKKIGSMEVEATGKALIEEINDELGIEIPCPGHRTISFYITETLGRFPKRGEILEGEGFTITVDEMHKYTLLKVTIEKNTG